MSSTIELKPMEMPFSNDPIQSYTMVARYYIDPLIADKEKKDIFWSNWIYVAHQSHLSKSGDYYCCSIHGQEIVLIKESDSEIRGFYNVCAHRGHQLLTGSGNTPAIVCPYHAWCYSNKGEFLGARNTQDMEGFDSSYFNLKPVLVESFLGFLFVNLDLDAKPMTELYDGLSEEILSYTPDVDKVQCQFQTNYSVKANWKVLIDNFLECYHCDTAHHDFVDLVDMPSYETKTYKLYSSHISHKPSNQSSAAYSFEGEQTFGYAAWFVWPNLTIWVMPGESNISMLQMHPDGVDNCIETLDWHGLGEEPNQSSTEAIKYLDEVLQPEDIALCESVQKGLNSLAYNQGRFVVDKDRSHLSEHGVHHFQALIIDSLKGN
jgi:choline monooxygenase